jgi:hypothetical protein
MVGVEGSSGVLDVQDTVGLMDFADVIGAVDIAEGIEGRKEEKQETWKLRYINPSTA